MDGIEILGLVAGLLTASAALPQLIKTYRSKDASDISLKMFIMVVTGIILWVVYGIKKSDMPIIATNGLALAFNATMLFFKLKYGKNTSKN